MTRSHPEDATSGFIRAMTAARGPGSRRFDNWRRPMFRVFVVAPLAMSLAGAVWAQGTPGSGGYGYGPHMMWWNGGWSAMFFGPLLMILLLAILVAAIVLLVRWLGGQGLGTSLSPPAKTALDILKERFARGEIDKTEFEERRRILNERTDQGAVTG
jgi:putative membrane protein